MHKEFLYQFSDFHEQYSRFICLVPFLPSYVLEAGCLYSSFFCNLFPIIVKVFCTYYNSGLCLGSRIGDRNVLSLLRYVACFGGGGGDI
jgi:hypothetical protein